MRLLKYTSQGTFRFINISNYDDVPRYAVLSHTWSIGDEEVTYSEIRDGTGKEKAGYGKLVFCAQQARSDDIEYFWLDTCCIDRTNHWELQEAIVSTFRWFQMAVKCYVLLADVSCSKRKMSGGTEHAWEESFRSCRWFTRGWTLQELLAPPVVEFFSRQGKLLGSKDTLTQQIHEITGIPVAALQGQPLSQFSVEERMRWMNGRTTTRREDRAYCLLGIFNVFMPPIYGEGDYAFTRLEKEIAHGAVIPQNVQLQHETSRFTTTETVESSFKLSYEPLAKSSFRLLTINPGRMGEIITGNLREYSLLDPPSYYALSYVWGSEPPIHRTVINDGEHFIQPNLFHALQRVRLPDGKYSIWVDTLCINQENVSEKNAQIRHMATIYGSASGVLIWLGEEDSTSKLALDFVSKVTSDEFRWSDLWWEQYGLAALAQMLERAWFRRLWVLQEAAFSKNSTIRCGDREVHMDYFTTAVKIIRDRLSTVPLSSNQVLTRFHASPAIRLIDTISGALRTSAKSEASRRRMTLETLVYLTTQSETSNHRDTIYALLNLANDAISLSSLVQRDSIVPDYTKPVLDVFVDFILHCCLQSGHIDVVCRPWAPSLSASIQATGKDGHTVDHLQIYPSWISSKDKLPFGNPSWRSQHRLHGTPLVSRGSSRCYYAHYGTRPQIFFGKTKHGNCDGSLHAKGLVLGEVVERSARMADAIITKECLDILRAGSHEAHTDSVGVPDVIWRTLCADRDANGERAPYFYQQAMLHLLEISSGDSKSDHPSSMFDEMSSIDPEELLDTELPECTEQFLTVVRDITWNRRTFRMKENKDRDSSLVGLVPQHAKIGDYICILYGCSVPVVLRKLDREVDETCWQLIGDAYVYGIMDGEAISRSSAEVMPSWEKEFRIL